MAVAGVWRTPECAQGSFRAARRGHALAHREVSLSARACPEAKLRMVFQAKAGLTQLP